MDEVLAGKPLDDMMFRKWLETKDRAKSKAMRHERQRCEELHKKIEDNQKERKVRARKLRASLEKSSVIPKPRHVFDPEAYAKALQSLQGNPLASAEGSGGCINTYPIASTIGMHRLKRRPLSSSSSARSQSEETRQKPRLDDDSAFGPAGVATSGLDQSNSRGDLALMLRIHHGTSLSRGKMTCRYPNPVATAIREAVLEEYVQSAGEHFRLQSKVSVVTKPQWDDTPLSHEARTVRHSEMSAQNRESSLSSAESTPLDMQQEGQSRTNYRTLEQVKFSSHRRGTYFGFKPEKQAAELDTRDPATKECSVVTEHRNLATQAFDALMKSDLIEILNIREPHPAVLRVVKIVCLFMGTKDRSWVGARNDFMGGLHQFEMRLKTFTTSADPIDPADLRKVNRYLKLRNGVHITSDYMQHQV